MGVPSLLHSAIENVVRNAARYTREGTERANYAGARPGRLAVPEAVIRIVDSGPGVPEEALDKLFRPFYRIDDARGRQDRRRRVGAGHHRASRSASRGDGQGQQSARRRLAGRDSAAFGAWSGQS